MLVLPTMALGTRDRHSGEFSDMLKVLMGV